jgi:DNA-directed RNA polymerase specialized sigma24 family protein
MRRYLIDHARGRPSAEFTALEGFENILPADSGKVDLAITVDRLLDELAETKPEWSTLVEMKFFLGLTDEETADAMGVKLRTMQRSWSDARRWLFTRMEADHAQSAG